MRYHELVAAMISHLDEWHTTDDDGTRTCDYLTDCILDGFQGSTFGLLEEVTP